MRQLPRYRIQYCKKGQSAYISHLDLVRTLARAFRRAALPIAYSEGFNPHPRFSFAAPLPVGTEGLAEVLDVEMQEQVAPQELADRLNHSLPPGLAVLEVSAVQDNAPAPMAVLNEAGYLVHLDEQDWPGSLLDGAVQDFLNEEHIEVTRKGKDGRDKIRDIRPGIVKLDVLEQASGLTMQMQLKSGSAMNVRPEDVMEAFFNHADITMDKADLKIIRTGLF